MLLKLKKNHKNVMFIRLKVSSFLDFCNFKSITLSLTLRQPADRPDGPGLTGTAISFPLIFELLIFLGTFIGFSSMDSSCE